MHLCRGRPGSPEGTRNSGALCAERKHDRARKKRCGGKRQDLLRSTSEVRPNLPAVTDEARPFPRTHGSRGGGLTHLRQTLPTRDSPVLFPAPGWQQWFFLTFLPLDRANEGAHGEKSLPFLRQPPAKKQVLRPAPLPGAGRAAPTRGCKPSPLARAGAFPSRVVSQQTCCWPWRGSRAAQVCRCYPSLPPPAGSGHTPILEGGSFPPSWRCRGARAREQLPGSR